MYCIGYRDLLSHCNWTWWWMALWVLMWQYGFILGLWLSLAIISIPWGYIVSEPLLALRGGVEDLIYLSQGLRDHPARLLYRIIPGSLVLLLKGTRKRRCNMQLHTCQTVLRLVIPEEWSTEGNAFKCILCRGLLCSPKKSGILVFCLRGCNPVGALWGIINDTIENKTCLLFG